MDAVQFSELGERDTLVIITASSSVYRFTLNDRSAMRGALQGGNVRGSKEVVAGGCVDSNSEWFAGVCVGQRALFVVKASEDGSLCHQLMTSPVTDVKIQRAAMTIPLRRDPTRNL
jgi:hypothetical protein